MSSIRSKHTKPENAVRSMLHKMGFRFRLHRRDLPGNPDIVLPKYKAVIFVHGCFWHLHKNCIDGRIPKTDTKRWRDKLEGNVIRNNLNIRALTKSGWKTLVIWECEVNKSLEKVQNKIVKFLNK